MRRTLGTTIFASICVMVVGLVASDPILTAAHAAKTTATVTSATIKTAAPGTVYKGGLFVEPWGAAATAEKNLMARGATREAAAARTIAAQPIAVWLSGYYSDADLVALIERDVFAAEAKGTTPVFVTYNIPNRDCGGQSSGGARTDAEYLQWNALVANTLKGHRAVVLVEPDSLGHLSTCPDKATSREATIKSAAQQFWTAGVPVYLDGGNSNWVKPEIMEGRLRAAGVSFARGFYTNVANYRSETLERRYAEDLAARLGPDVHYVVDIGRNGQLTDGGWCNAVGAGLGRTPRVALNGNRIDAFLWVKTPGASDGQCNGGPAPGKWYADYAIALVKNRSTLP